MKKHQRRIKSGFDIEKLRKIWRTLEAQDDYAHVSGLAALTGINQVTVRYYLDHYLAEVTESVRIVPSIRLRLVKLKPGVELERHLMFLKVRQLARSQADT